MSHFLSHYIIFCSHIPTLSFSLALAPVVSSPKGLSARSFVLLLRRPFGTSRGSAASAGGPAAALGSARPRRAAGAAAAGPERLVTSRVRGQPTAPSATGDARPFFLLTHIEDQVNVNNNTFNRDIIHTTLTCSSILSPAHRDSNTVEHPSPNTKEKKIYKHISLPANQ